jgi:cell division protein FtsI/penicillin-binding protein 2
VARELIGMLQGVVSGGTGEEAAVPGYVVAGKTGTAAKPDSSGGYSNTRYVASFVGIVPASAPRLVVLVSINEPQGEIFGGVVAAPAFRDIARFALQYLDVPPDDAASLPTASGGAPPSG